ncbi:PucR family transcriptional regulator [Mycolicibacterium sp. F2034L]|uniref:PucR family transcriptional regulator n=1 Tax=Mycolicibacterium sp. F2034L TaxID=2926422 RepID=UPI001FF23B6A|nr:PucR family transcriptional regulator [Mycolicibacterium sp. F2034L]MCK0173084.1 helix-turn-helix domain-containing protein [Mycolicibacterium sp. F2034L]
MSAARVRLGDLLLALDRTMVTLAVAPRGLDAAVGSVALVDADDVRLGVAHATGNADLFFLLGVPDEAAARWLEQQVRRPVAVFVKEPTAALQRRAARLGVAVVAVDPHARWERAYRLVTQFLEHVRDDDDPHLPGGNDLFALAQSVADRTRGLVTIEDDGSHVLAYSSPNDEADDLRRLSILGREGPPAHLQWLADAGVFDALRSGSDVVRVPERPELRLRPRLAVGIHLAATRRPPRFGGTIWLQQGGEPLADGADEALRGGAVLAARILARMAATPSVHTLRLRDLLGLTDTDTGATDTAAIARDLGLEIDSRAALIGFRGGPGLTEVIALSATAFRADAQVVPADDRVYVLLPKIGAPSTVTSWVRGVVATMHRERGATVRAVIAAPLAGLDAAAATRLDIDRVFDSASRHPGAIGQVTSLSEARTTVLLDDIVAQVAGQPRLIDPRIPALREQDPILAETLAAYLDGFGDIAAVARRLHVHANTVRYRVRRLESILGDSLDDADDRLVLALSLRATDPITP